MTQNHKNKQTLQVLSRKALGKWKRKTVVLKKSVENQKILANLHIHRLKSRAIRKIYKTANVIQIAPCSHAVIREPEVEKPNALGLLKLQANSEEDSCYFFAAVSEQEISDLNKLGDTIQELSKVTSFHVDIDSDTDHQTPIGPAYLHISKNKAYLSSKTPPFTVLKEWEFHSLQIFSFEVRGIHIHPRDLSRGGVFLCCRSSEDARRIEQIISSQCNSGATNPMYQRVLPPPPVESESISTTSSSSVSFSTFDYSCPSSPTPSDLRLSPTSPIPESPVFSTCNTNHFQNTLTNAQCGLSLPGRSNSVSVISSQIPKSPLKTTQSSPMVTTKKFQSPKHSVDYKEHVDIRYPDKNRSKSALDLTITRPLDKVEEEILRASSLDSPQADALRKKSKAAKGDQISSSSFSLHYKPQNENVTKQSDVNNNAESIDNRGWNNGAAYQWHEGVPSIKTLPSLISKSNKNIPEATNECKNGGSKSTINENMSETTKESTTSYSPLYVNFETRPNCYIYRNVSYPDDAPDIANTYINVFSGSSIKGCYENWDSGVSHQEFLYSSIEDQADVPPPVPNPRRPPPRLPPRKNQSHREEFPGKSRNVFPKCPPEIPPKRPPKTVLSTSQPSLRPLLLVQKSAEGVPATPRIQVALFASPPTSGLVWFLRVAFMHQDDSDTTFKRVNGIEEASNHMLKKYALLEVSTDINVTVNLLTKGFDLLNESQQEVEISDIDNLRKGDWFVIEFRIQQSDPTQCQLNGNVSVGPKGTTSTGRRFRADMGISENFQTMLPQSPTASTPTSGLFSIGYSTYDKLCRALDQTMNTQSCDWRQVADALGFTFAEIKELQDKSHRCAYFSPTDTVLQQWVQRDPKCSKEKLVNILREKERLDIVQDLGYSIEPESKLNNGVKKV